MTSTAGFMAPPFSAVSCFLGQTEQFLSPVSTPERTLWSKSRSIHIMWPTGDSRHINARITDSSNNFVRTFSLTPRYFPAGIVSLHFYKRYRSLVIKMAPQDKVRTLVPALCMNKMQCYELFKQFKLYNHVGMFSCASVWQSVTDGTYTLHSGINPSPLLPWSLGCFSAAGTFTRPWG